MTCIKLIKLASIYPTEEIDLNNQKKVSNEIRKSMIWTNPIVIHEKYYFVMDGHHRLKVAEELSLDVIPVVLRNYSNTILKSWRDDWCINEELVLSMFKENRLFPHKTTRHIFIDEIPKCSYSLLTLGLK